MEQRRAAQGMLGERLGGRYRVVRLISAGAEADLFEAEDERLPRRVAVKLGHADHATDGGPFDRGAKRRGPDHPDLARVLDGGEHDGFPYVVMELGGDPTRVMSLPDDRTHVLPAGLVPTPELEAEPSGATAAVGSFAASLWAHRALLVLVGGVALVVVLLGLALGGDDLDVTPSTVPVTAEPTTTVAPTTTSPPTTESPPAEGKGEGEGRGKGKKGED